LDGFFEAHFARVAEHHITLRVLQVLVQAHAVAGLAQDAGECRLAHLDGLPSQICAVQLKQVETGRQRRRTPLLTSKQSGEWSSEPTQEESAVRGCRKEAPGRG
jgi:hypothetical protein